MALNKKLAEFLGNYRETRKQLAYCLRYLRRCGEYAPPRGYVEEHIETYCTSTNEISVASLTDALVDTWWYPSEAYLRSYSAEDSEGYLENYIEVYAYRKQTDEEYFDTICERILPTEYQQKQYQEYLRLKNMFEKEDL